MRAVLFAVTTALGCNDLECGIGTVEREGQCVNTLIVACGPGTRFERGYCVPADVAQAVDAEPSADTSDAASR